MSDRYDAYGRWDIAANMHLLAYVRHKRVPGRPASYLGMKRTTREESPNADASPEFIANVRLLVDAKNAWASDMRDLAPRDEDGVPAELQRKIWDDYITRAEARMTGSIWRYGE